MTRYALLAAGLAVIVGLGLAIDAQSRMPAHRPVNHSPPHSIFAPGRVEGATPEIELRIQLDGRIEELLAAEGQIVAKDEVLLWLDSAQYGYEVALATAELNLAEAELERLINGARPQERSEAAALLRAKQAELERAQLSWERIDNLHRAKAVSQQEADDQRALVASLTAEVEAAKARFDIIQAPARLDDVSISTARIQAAQARLELAKVRIDRTVLKSPGSGQILKINVEPGELTGPESPQPAIVLVDTSKLQVRAFIEEMDAPRLKLGMPATITADGLPERQFKGRITRLSPHMGLKQLRTDHPAERFDTKTREVWIELENIDGLVVGLRVDVKIDIASLKGASGDLDQGTSPPNAR